LASSWLLLCTTNRWVHIFFHWKYLKGERARERERECVCVCLGDGLFDDFFVFLGVLKP
jgi:hypothetical protein